MESVPRRLPGRAPIIGVCGVPAVMSSGYWSQAAVLVAETYLSAIRRVGGTPVILPPVNPSSAPAVDVLRALDGVVLAGGTDVSPEVYGEVAGLHMEEAVLDRDLYELVIATAALERDLPVLGVCRGLQILNVATGGTLHQHLLDGGYAEHSPAPGRLDDVTNHAVEGRADQPARLLRARPSSRGQLPSPPGCCPPRQRGARDCALRTRRRRGGGRVAGMPIRARCPGTRRTHRWTDFSPVSSRPPGLSLRNSQVPRLPDVMHWTAVHPRDTRGAAT